MKILQCGFPKSGNYWLYKIIRLIREKSDIPENSFIHKHPIYDMAKTWELSFPEQVDINMLDIHDSGHFFRISSRYREKIDDIKNYVKENSHVWTHSNFCENSKTSFPLFDKIIYIIRDPRDVAISTSRFAFSSYMSKHYPTRHLTPDIYLDEEFEIIMRSWANHVEKYLSERNNYHIFTTFYEQWRVRFDDELDNLLNYLGLELTQKQKQEIKKEASFKNLKKKNPRSLRKGNFYGWMKELEFKHKEKALDIAAPLLKSLNYPMKDFYESPPLPFFLDQNLSGQLTDYNKSLENPSRLL